MPELDVKHIGQYMDISAVRTDVKFSEVDDMIRIIRENHCICAVPMPWAAKYTIEALKDMPEIVVTGVVGFPAGAETTFIKVATAKELISLGCKELDMVMNVSAMLSGQYEYVENDIRAVVDAAGDVPVKTILEVGYLTDDQIRRASEIVVKAGAVFVKTGTGWGPRPTTVQDIRLIKETIGDSAYIKAAGGVHSLAVMQEMAAAGCNRFGIGVRTAEKIIEEAKNC